MTFACYGPTAFCFVFLKQTASHLCAHNQGYCVLNSRTIRGKVVVPSKPRRPPSAGDPQRLRQRHRQRRPVMHGAAHPDDSRCAERGDGQDLLQPRDQRAVGQVSRTRH